MAVGVIKREIGWKSDIFIKQSYSCSHMHTRWSTERGDIAQRFDCTTLPVATVSICINHTYMHTFFLEFIE